MTISMFMCRLTQSIINVPCSGKKLNMRQIEKEKIVVVMGATGAGKSRLSIDLATCFPSEIINSDKIQVYEGLDIVTNKISKEDQRGVPHHLLGIINPNMDFSANDFCDTSSEIIASITRSERLPIIVGGSNSYLEALIDDDDYKCRSRFDFLCLWVDVAMPDLQSYVAERVDDMLYNGMVDELRPFYSPNGDYSRGVRRAIGVPEFDEYFRREEEVVDEETRTRLLEEAVKEMKLNTCKLAMKQLGKIRRLRNVKRWEIHRLDATPVFRRRGEEANEAWKKLVAEPSAMIVARFLYNSNSKNNATNVVSGSGLRVKPATSSETVLAAATC
ncbi:adenylate isopentenyltransferase 3, chloroplastic-like [Glycine soja]|uniref:adenylate dimethylallyltransferase (ADP/ATP-dependent) n=1 Tax=Glycine soja TaxID=3848 RepID=A0A445IGX4_GLYSO|nr:adenylate isopentenyltransferase 3, chloroplastic-like [Glycine soja]RZB85357.1 Adenylate isopentenyltransferase 3, chloroplastic [Glycine soja]